jgi:hypothetical protein
LWKVRLHAETALHTFKKSVMVYYSNHKNKHIDPLDSFIIFSYMSVIFNVLDILSVCKIWGFHSGDHEEWCLLACYAMWLL